MNTTLTFRRLLIALVALSLPAGAFSQSPRPQPIIHYGGGGWKDGQVNEPCILVNPRDPTKLIMFFSAMKLGGRQGAIGKAWADVSQPLVWHEDPANPIFVRDPAIGFESSDVRVDTVLYHAERDEYWIYYTGFRTRPIANAIGLATCPVGKDGYSEVTAANIRRHAGNPILSPGGQGRDDESFVSQSAIVREGNRWYALYSYRTPKQTLPGIRLATSDDGLKWEKTPGPDLLTAAPEHKYIEWHQLSKIGDRWVLLYEGYRGGTQWHAEVATSTSLTEGWQKQTVPLLDQMKWPGYGEDKMFHVATPAVYRIGGKWYLYFQAAPAGDYIHQHWTLWGTACDDVLKQLSLSKR